MEIHLILMTHGDWSQALVDSTQLIIGDLPWVHVLPLWQQQSPAQYEAQAETLLRELGDIPKILVSDMMGGTPYYVAATLGKKYGCPTLNGLSMVLLLALCHARETLNAEETAAAAVQAARFKTGSVQEHLSRAEL